MMSVGDIMSTLGDVQYTGDTMSTLGFTMMSVEDIISTLGVFNTPGCYHEYTGDTKMHAGGYHVDTMSTPVDFGTNEKRPVSNFQNFCSGTFCDYAVVFVGL